MAEKLPPDFLAKLKSVTAKRARVVIDHILKHGQITTDELKSVYGYNHPPRAIRDVKEEGIPIQMRRVTGPDGRKISAYTFGDPHDLETHKTGGRRVFPKKFKAQLIAQYGNRCGICHADLEDRYLQIDHRVPYEVSGEAVTLDPAAFMLICGSCNRAKSWSCEHCPNTLTKDPAVCETCYWAVPDDYQHIATRHIRRLDLVWSEGEVSDFDALKRDAAATSEALPEFVKACLRARRNKPRRPKVD